MWRRGSGRSGYDYWLAYKSSGELQVWLDSGQRTVPGARIAAVGLRSPPTPSRRMWPRRPAVPDLATDELGRTVNGLIRRPVPS
jgi:hypothetical protein